jgi:hypothetical protein
MTTNSPGWAQIRRVCRALTADTQGLVNRQVERIRAELPQYEVVPVATQRAAVAVQTVALLTDLEKAARPTAAHLEVARALGADRADDGLDVAVIMQAFHLGCIEVWHAIVATASRPSHALLDAADVMWTWVHLVSAAMAEGHAQATQAAHERLQNARWRFLRAITGDQGDKLPSELADLAESLGFEPEREFEALCSPAELWTEADLRAVAAAIGRRPGTGLIAVVEHEVLVLLQRAGSRQVVRDIVGRDIHAIGVGLPRAGMRGARESFADAREALQLAIRTKTPAFWSDDWLWASLNTRRERLGSVLGATKRPVHPDGHLASTVRSFADHRMSIAATGRALGIHANSVAYRLSRWNELTGWDPGTFDGLARSLAHIHLYSSEADQAELTSVPVASPHRPEGRRL